MKFPNLGRLKMVGMVVVAGVTLISIVVLHADASIRGWRAARELRRKCGL